MTFRPTLDWLRLNGLEVCAIRAAVFATSLAALVFVAMRFGLPGWVSPGMILPAALVAACVAADSSPLDPPNRRRDELVLLCVGLALGWVSVLFRQGWALPVGDPIAVPQFARTIAAGSLLTDAFPPGSSGHAYPPGYPILFAPAAAFLSPLDALAFFKGLTLLTVGLIPLAWAWLHKRLFAPQTPFWICVVVAYLAFFVAERTLGFAVPFAGKNAVLLGLLLLPAVTMATLSWASHPRRWPLAVIPMFGLILVHYTMLHLLAALLGSYLVVELLLGRRRWPVLVRILSAAAVAVGLLVVVNHDALLDPRAGTMAFDPIGGVGRLAKLLAAQRPPFAIFMDGDFGLPGAPFRGIALAACAAFAVLIGISMKQRALFESAAVYLMAFLASLAFAVGIVPAGIKLDFVRWFVWPLQAAIFLTAGLAFLGLFSVAPSRFRRLGGAALGLVAMGYGLAVLYADGRAERSAFKQNVLSHAELTEMVGLLPKSPMANGCYIMGESDSGSIDGVTVQRATVWAYAEAVSPCVYLTGSWVQPGAAHGRDEAGFPSSGALLALPAGAEVVFVGRPEVLQPFWTRMKAQGVDWSLKPVGRAAPDVEIWRRVRAVEMGAVNPSATSLRNRQG